MDRALLRTIEHDPPDMIATHFLSLPADVRQQVMRPSLRLAAEVEEGNHEYKLKLTNLTDEQLNHRVTQLLWRLREGNNEAYYHIGVEDNGNPIGLSSEDLEKSLQTLKTMAEKANCDMIIQHLLSGEQGITAEVQMKSRARSSLDSPQVTVAFAGDEDCGKSTLVSVLSTGQLDNGKGLARMRVLKHDHEVESGCTSSVSHTPLHFDSTGQVLNHGGKHRVRALTDLELAQLSARCVSLVDLAGRARYLKTTLRGLSALHPDHCLVCVSAVKGVQPMTAEHMGIGVSLQVPLGVVVTKCDLVPAEKMDVLLRTLAACLRCRTVCLRTHTDLVAYLDGLLVGGAAAATAWEDSVTATAEAEVTVPIFLVSSVTGQGVGLLTSFLHQLPSVRTLSASDPGPLLVRILGSFPRSAEDLSDDESVGSSDSGAGVDTARVYIGRVVRGVVRVRDALSLGPVWNGGFAAVHVASLRISNVPVQCARAGQIVTICVGTGVRADVAGTRIETKGGKRCALAGMVLVAQPAAFKPVLEFEALVTVLHASVRVHYEAVVHVGAVQQSARVLRILPLNEGNKGTDGGEQEACIASGQTRRCVLRFVFYPEVVESGDKMILREDRTRAVGTILRCL